MSVKALKCPIPQKTCVCSLSTCGAVLNVSFFRHLNAIHIALKEIYLTHVHNKQTFLFHITLNIYILTELFTKVYKPTRTKHFFTKSNVVLTYSRILKHLN